MIANLKPVTQIEPPQSVSIKRAFPGDKETILRFVRENFSSGWVSEAEYAILQAPPKCFIAVEDGQVVGFACYDASARGFFGPIGVRDDQRGRHVGAALLTRTLIAMREYGYAYAVIGWVDDAEPFYRRIVGAQRIPGGTPENSIYANMIRF